MWWVSRHNREGPIWQNNGIVSLHGAYTEARYINNTTFGRRWLMLGMGIKACPYKNMISIWQCSSPLLVTGAIKEYSKSSVTFRQLLSLIRWYICQLWPKGAHNRQHHLLWRWLRGTFVDNQWFSYYCWSGWHSDEPQQVSICSSGSRFCWVSHHWREDWPSFKVLQYHTELSNAHL